MAIRYIQKKLLIDKILILWKIELQNSPTKRIIRERRHKKNIVSFCYIRMLCISIVASGKNLYFRI